MPFLAFLGGLLFVVLIKEGHEILAFLLIIFMIEADRSA